MKTRTIQIAIVLLTLGVIFLALTGCSTPSDPTFMRNASAAIQGGMVQTPDGRMMMSPGLQNRSHPHPFFGAP